MKIKKLKESVSDNTTYNDFKIYGEAAKFQTKMIEIIEVDLTVHLIETIIDM